MKITFERILIVILSLVLVFSMFTCKNVKSELTAQKLENQKLDSIVNKYGQTIYTQEALIVSNDADRANLRHLTDSLFNLTSKQQKQIKDVLAFYKSVGGVKIVEVGVPYIDTIGVKKWEDSVQRRCSDVIAYYEANTISVPRTARDSTKYYDVSFTVKQESLNINKINIPDTQYIRFTTLKGGILKKDTYGKRHLILGKRIQTQVLHTNPYVKVTGQSSVIYKAPKKSRWFQKTLLIGGGIFLGTKL